MVGPPSVSTIRIPMAAFFIWKFFSGNISGRVEPLSTKGDAFMFNPSQDWVAYVFIAFFIGFWIFIIIKGRKHRDAESRNEGPERDNKAPHED